MNRNQEIRMFVATLRLGLIVGLFTKEEVINWTDTVINKSETPENILIEISTSSKLSTKELSSFITELIEIPTLKEIIPIILDIFRRQVRNQSLQEKDIDTLKRIKQTIENEECFYDIVVILEYYYLAKEKIVGNIKEQEKNIINYLSKFEGKADLFFELIS